MTHGGRREGAGRPPKNQTAGRRVDLYLPEYQIKWLKRENNMSAKIQKIITSEMANEIYDLVYTGDDKYLEPALKLVRYSVARQKPSGAWDYGEHATQGWADNFHTGYNLCALRSIARNIGTGEFDAAIQRGFEFYRVNFFKENGAPKYFHDRTYPIDAHCVAQSIITLLEFRDLDAGSIDMAEKVYSWAMENLWDTGGYFYYQVQPVYKNRISYMRWTQAWMLLALTKLLEQQTK